MLSSRTWLFLRGRPVRLVRLGERFSPEASVGLVTHEEAIRLFRPLLADPQERLALLQYVADVSPCGAPRTDAEVLFRLASALMSGRLRLAWVVPRSAPQTGGTRQPEVREAIDEEELVWPQPEPEWFEVALSDENGDPVPGLRYLIVAPDGREYRGRTDSSGVVRLAQVPGGDCTVTFFRDELA